VPKLNLTPLLKEQEEHAQSVREAYADASADADADAEGEPRSLKRRECLSK